MKSLVFGIIVVGLGLIFYKAQQILAEPETLWENENLSADCGVVLTGGSGRLREAFEFLSRKKIKKLIVSGVYKDSKLTEVFPYSPFYPEVDLDDIFLEKRSETTFGNARHSLSLVEGLKCRDIVLITSQVHMLRAYSIFKIVYPETIPIKKLSLPNSKGESSWIGMTIEVIKNLSYYILSLVEQFGL